MDERLPTFQDRLTHPDVDPDVREAAESARDRALSDAQLQRAALEAFLSDDPAARKAAVEALASMPTDEQLREAADAILRLPHRGGATTEATD